MSNAKIQMSKGKPRVGIYDSGDRKHDEGEGGHTLYTGFLRKPFVYEGIFRLVQGLGFALDNAI